MTQLCKYCNKYPSFGGGYCSYHQYRRRMKGGDLYVKSQQKKPVEPRSPKKRYKIPPVSEKRKITADIYRQITQDMWDDAVKSGTNYCFFSGERMEKKEPPHHLKGRDGFLFIDPDWLVLAKLKYHDLYHSLSVDKLEKEWWYSGFLERLRAKSEELYQLELKKFEKAEPVRKLNPPKDYDQDFYDNLF